MEKKGSSSFGKKPKPAKMKDGADPVKNFEKWKKKYNKTKTRVKRERAQKKKPEWQVEREYISRLVSRYGDINNKDVVKFSDFPISKKTLLGLQEAQYRQPTEIQRQTVGFALQGKDVLGAAKTGSGKTLAFLIPVLECLYRQQWSSMDGLGALIISPTRELAYQTFEVLRKVGKNHEFSAGLIIGGKDLKSESERIQHTNIVICTPGRLLQHMDETATFHASNLHMLVLDEADRILDMGFADTLNAIVENLPKTRQTLLFSATQTKSVKDLARLSLKDPEYVWVHEKAKFSTPATLEQNYVVCELHQKVNMLYSFIRSHLKKKIIVFFACCKEVQYLFRIFCRLRPGMPILALHGKQQQMKRVEVYKDFLKKNNAVLFATDIAARGLDFPAVNWVLQFDCPEDADTYIHRVGRTARYKEGGEALLLLLPSEEKGMTSQLQEKKVPINKIQVNAEKLQNVQQKLEAFLAQETEQKERAQRCFVSYLRSVFLMKNKEVFDVFKLQLHEYALSLGLAVAPRVRFLNKAQAQRAEKGGQREEEEEEEDRNDGAHIYIAPTNAALVHDEFRLHAAELTPKPETIMATDKVVIEAKKLELCGADNSVQVKILHVPPKCGSMTAVHPPHTAAGDCVSAPPKVIPHQPASSAVTVPGLQTSSPSVVVITKVATPSRVSANSQPQVTKPALSQVTSMSQTTTPGRTVVITVPRAAAPQTVAVAPRLPQGTSPQLPANIQIPPGMMLIRSDSGQLMLVSQQALAQAQQAPRGISGQAPRILTPQVSVMSAIQVCATAGNKSNEKVTVIRMAAPPGFQPAPVQKTAVVKVIGVAPKPAVAQNLSAVSERGSQPRIQAVITETKKEPPATFSRETMESVKKCKNFLVTLIKLASSDSRSANMANNVRGLVMSLLEGKLEAQEFTEQLYRELKSTPQPCLVPFLEKSLPAVRRLTADPELFIQQASTSTCHPITSSSTMKQPSTGTGPNFTMSQQVKKCRTFSVKQPFAQDSSRPAKFAFKDSSGSYKEDDDINDVASMAGVNLREENAQILTTMVGSVVQSCHDQPFLSPNPLLCRILQTGQALGITDVGPEVVALVSHATQECLRGLIEKLTVMAEHRKAALKEDLWHTKVSDVRSQLRFLEEVESLKKKRKDEEERERLLRLARSRSHTEDPHHQQLKQRAKELQQIEQAQLQQREANLTALAAIGPRKKRPVEQTESQPRGFLYLFTCFATAGTACTYDRMATVFGGQALCTTLQHVLLHMLRLRVY
ncbi:putative ATP-dependent RNA helicase DDX10 [Nibea albiflora]|uniref:ATP-dependent RNA helicase DDX10 n=1 Tax=Nibea albiflora TaxID=240163 RepID=A0ACB7EMH6_NIBAL|nr:putative ATP-dependent RNA helicase DDX10 [Nibea albiflora]